MLGDGLILMCHLWTTKAGNACWHRV